MNTFYRITKYPIGIEPVEVERFTEKSVWIEGHRQDRLARDYFETFESAKTTLLARHRLRVSRAQSMLRNARKELEEAERAVNK